MQFCSLGFQPSSIPAVKSDLQRAAYSWGDSEGDIKRKQVPTLCPLCIHPREFCHLDFFQKLLTPLMISAHPSGAAQVLLMEGLRLCICKELT